MQCHKIKEKYNIKFNLKLIEFTIHFNVLYRSAKLFLKIIVKLPYIEMYAGHIMCLVFSLFLFAGPFEFLDLPLCYSRDGFVTLYFFDL